MNWYEYMNIPVKDIPASIMEQYKLAGLAHNGHVLVKTRKGVYGLPQAGIIANECLVKHLATYGYAPSHQTQSRPLLHSYHTACHLFSG